jgi:hypothetical protein
MDKAFAKIEFITMTFWPEFEEFIELTAGYDGSGCILKNSFQSPHRKEPPIARTVISNLAREIHDLIDLRNSAN